MLNFKKKDRASPKSVKLEGEQFEKAKVLVEARRKGLEVLKKKGLFLSEELKSLENEDTALGIQFFADVCALVNAEVTHGLEFEMEYESLGFYVLKNTGDCDCPLHNEAMRKALNDMPAGAISVDKLPPRLRKKLAEALMNGDIGAAVLPVNSPKKQTAH